MTKGSIEISAFVPRLAHDTQLPPRVREPLRRWRTWSFLQNSALRNALCAVITICVHAPLVEPFLRNAMSQSPAQRATGMEGILANRGESDRLEAWIIQEDNAAQSNSLEKHFDEPTLIQLSLRSGSAADSLPKIKIADAESGRVGIHPAVENAEPAVAGSYLEQIQDHVNRSWLRPKIAIGAPVFACHVLIDQDTTGNIQKVTLEECGENVRWQLSLLTAIRAASPLPVPGDPSAFRSTLHVVFRSNDPTDLSGRSYRVDALSRNRVVP